MKVYDAQLPRELLNDKNSWAEELRNTLEIVRFELGRVKSAEAGLEPSKGFRKAFQGAEAAFAGLAQTGWAPPGPVVVSGVVGGVGRE